MRYVKALGVCAVMVHTAACGQKGPLVLPDKHPQAPTQAPAPAPVPTPAPVPAPAPAPAAGPNDATAASGVSGDSAPPTAPQ